MTDLDCRQLSLAAALSCAWLVPTLSLAQTEPEVLADAEPRGFTVEVIVFRYAQSVSAGTEMFIPDPPPEILSIGDEGEFVYGDLVNPEPKPERMDADGEPIGDEPPEGDFLIMIEDELTMLSQWDRLDRLDAYEPLAHFGWVQDVIPFGEPVEIPLADLAEPIEGLDGTFKLYLSRFLHLAVALELEADPDDPRNELPPALGEEPTLGEEPALGEEPLEGPINADGTSIVTTAEDPYGMPRGTIFYRIDEDRIFRSGDLRYFDHPRFGMLAKIERVEEEESEESDESASLSVDQGE